MAEKETDKFAIWAEEKVGLPNYSNVTVGASLTRILPPGLSDEEVLAQMDKAADEVVEKFVAVGRERVLESLKSQ